MLLVFCETKYVCVRVCVCVCVSRRMRAGQEGHEEEVGGGGKKAAEAAERVGGEEKGKRFA